MQFHHEWAVRKWTQAFTEDWHYEYLLKHLRAKLVTMERYNLRLSYDANGVYYGHQIRLAVKMIDIILQKGGEDDYGDNFAPGPEYFKHFVNMRNRSRIPKAVGEEDLVFWSEAEALRFDKAWMLLWRILSEQMIAWGDGYGK